MLTGDWYADIDAMTRVSNQQDGRLALHVVCALVPNFLFVDVIRAMVRGCEESVGWKDKVRSSL